MPGLPKLEKLTTMPGSDLRQLEIQHNNAVADDQGAAFAGSVSTVWAWSTVTANSLQPLGRGSTDTAIASGALRFMITGQAASEAKAAVTTGTNPTAQTVPADKWALYAFDIPTGGTIAMIPAALNTTGYATEAAAIAACPARLTAKARLGYVTVKTKASTAWIGQTDAFAGGASGNVASATNYYPVAGIFGSTGTPANVGLISGTVFPGGLWTGGANGPLIPTTLARGSTDTNVATIAFTYNAGGASDIAKAAVAAGTAFGALGTVTADKWAAIAIFIDGAGTLSFKSAPGNYTGDYGNEAQAQAGLGAIVSPANLAYLGYVTIKTKAATAFVVGTDALAGGASGNVASATNYYPTVGLFPPTTGPDFTGLTASQIANRAGMVVNATQY
jgi:hypothetical protein